MLNKTVDFYVKLLGQGWLRFIFKENVFKNISHIQNDTTTYLYCNRIDNCYPRFVISYECVTKATELD